MLLSKWFVGWIWVTTVSVGSIGWAICPAGDLNEDCAVDLQDLAVFAEQWLDSPDCSQSPCADLDNSGAVDLADLAILSQHWNRTVYPIVINEYMSSNHNTITDPDDPDQYPDWIELYNYGTRPIDIGGFWLTDEMGIPRKFPIPTGFPNKTTIPDGGFLLLWMDRDLLEGPTHIDFKLSATSSEFVGFNDPDGRPIDSLDTIPLGGDISHGRTRDGESTWQLFDPLAGSNPTPGISNGSFKDDDKIQISEIMYHPYNAAHPLAEDIREEFLELYNSGDRPVLLTGWRITRGVDFVFPDVTIQPRAYLVVAADLATFQDHNPQITNVVGGWIGRLSNSGETLELANARGRIIDSVRYADEGDWSVRFLGPVELSHRGWEWSGLTDGEGRSLELLNLSMTNEFGQNWAASESHGGTPGRTNSVAIDNIAPMILDVSHTPVIPKPTDPVTVTARILAEQANGLSVSLRYRTDASTYQGTGVYPSYDPNSFTKIAMFDDGAHGDGAAEDGIYGGQIPPMADKAIVEFFVQATDHTAASRTWPAPSLIDNVPQQVTNLLYQVDGSFDPAAWTAGQQPFYYLIMTEMERGRLAYIGSHSTLSGPNSQMNGTFISRDGVDLKCRYLVGIRNRGHGSRNGPPNNYHVNFPHDRTWNGLGAINFNCRYTHAQIIGRAIYSLAGMVAPDAEPAEVRINGTDLATPGSYMYGIYVRLEAFDSDFAAKHFPNDSNGNLYSCFRDNGEAELTYDGDDPDTYRNRYYKESNASFDDWTDLIHMVEVLNNAPDPNYLQQVGQVVNVSQWLHYIALDSLLQNYETGLNMGIGDDYFLYCGITDPRFVLIPHDLDTILWEGNSHGNINQSIFSVILGAGSGNGVKGLERFLKHPDIVPLFYQAFLDHINGVFNSQTLDPLFDRVIGGFASTRVASMKQYVRDRTTAVLAQIPQTITVTTAVNAQTGYIHTTTNKVSLAGKANAIRTRRITVNGQPTVWMAWQASWTINYSGLRPGLNRMIIQAFDAADTEFERASVDVWYNSGLMSSKSGSLTSNEVWTVTGGPYQVTATVTVPAGRTLTIEPGATIFFDPAAGLIVEGRLVAIGEDFARIRLNHVPGQDHWQSVSFLDTNEDNRLVYVDVEFGGNQVEKMVVEHSRIVMDHVTFAGTSTTMLELTHPRAVIRNTIFPSVGDAEPIHGTGLDATEFLIFDGCAFGQTIGYNDTIDFAGGKRPGNIFQVYNSLFLGGGDDGPDLDTTDAHIEGNLFTGFHHTTGGDSTSNCIATGDGAEVCIVRNIFQNSDYAILYKEDSYGWVQNNTFENVGIASVSFGEPYRDPPRTPGRGTYMDSNIFWNNAAIWEHNFDTPAGYGPTGPVYVYRSLLPAAWHSLGSGNIDAAPQFVSEYEDLHLRPGSAGVGTGANGLDMGAYVPAGASLSGEPSAVTWKTEAHLTVGGPGITDYKYRVVDNNIPGDWSPEIPLPINSGDFPADPDHIFGTIHLTGLQIGHSYRVDVRGKNSAGLWQGEPYGDTGFVVPGLLDGNRSRTWTIDIGYRRLVINEVLARNAGTLPVNGAYPNLIELYYDAPGTTPLNLSGMKITDGGTTVNEYVFPANTQILPGEYKVLYADRDTLSPGIHLGFFLNGEGDAVKLYTASDELIDGVEFGFQTAGMSIGRIGPEGEWVLCEPTFGQANSVQSVREPRRMRINEWFAHGEVRFTEDFVELYNPEEIPVRIDGVCLTDNPFSEPTKFRLPALSFIGSRECIVLWSQSGGNANDLNFNLQTESGLLALLDPDGRLIDGVIYPDQTVDHSQGRSPDGADTMVFFSIPTPGVSNPQAPTVVTETTMLIPEDAAKRVLVPSEPIDSAWKGGAPFDDSEWSSGVYVSGKVGGVGYEENPDATTNFTDLISYDIQSMKSVPTGSCYIRVPFSLTAEQLATIQRLNLKIRRDDAFIAYVNGMTATQSTNIPTNPSWNSYASASGPSDSTARQLADFPISDAAVLGSLKVGENSFAVHGMDASNSTDMIISFILEIVTQHVEGNNDMASYEALADGLRITELMYQPSSGGVEFVELKNVGDQSLNLKGVRFLDGIEYEFGSRTLGPGQFVVVTPNVPAFQARYGTGIAVVGPYTGVLRDRGEKIALSLPDPYPAAILRFDYQPDWYPLASGGGHSLVIRDDQSWAWMWDHAEGWRASSEAGGSPGTEDPL